MLTTEQETTEQKITLDAGSFNNAEYQRWLDTLNQKKNRSSNGNPAETRYSG